MPVIISQCCCSGGGGGGGADHTHSNLATLNALKSTGAGKLSVSGVDVGESAIETRYEIIVESSHITAKKIDLPYDCDIKRALTLVLESSPMRMGDDWEVIEREAPSKDYISWNGLGMERFIKVGDNVSITYYKKK